MPYSALPGVSPRGTSPSGAAEGGCPRTPLQPHALPSLEMFPSLVPSLSPLVLQDSPCPPLT